MIVSLVVSQLRFADEPQQATFSQERSRWQVTKKCDEPLLWAALINEDFRDALRVWFKFHSYLRQPQEIWRSRGIVCSLYLIITTGGYGYGIREEEITGYGRIYVIVRGRSSGSGVEVKCSRVSGRTRVAGEAAELPQSTNQTEVELLSDIILKNL